MSSRGQKRTRKDAGFAVRRGVVRRRIDSSSAFPVSRAITVVPRSFGNARAVTERKYFDSNASGTVPDISVSWAGAEIDPPTLGALFAPTEGNDINNRIARKVFVHAIKIKGYFVSPAQINQTAADSISMIRFALVQDTQTNAIQLNAEDVFTSSGTAFNQFQNTAFFGRFRVLKDKRFVLQNPTLTWDGTNLEQSGIGRQFKINFKFRKPMMVRYNATNGGTVADVIDNSFHLIGGTLGTTLQPTYAYSCRVVYTDP